MKFLARIVQCGLFVLPLATAMAAPIGYSVNSDAPDGDTLFLIDLATGAETPIGKVQHLGVTRLDIEGLAFDNNGLLWAVDDETRQLFAVNTTTGQVIPPEIPITGLTSPSRNDFGMTFTCSGELYLSTIIDQSFYRVSPTGVATKIGPLGARISSLASIGTPARVFGLGNGMQGEKGPQDNRSLYEINTQTGAATLIGVIGPAAGDYFETGLSFDEAGNLWAITDRSLFDTPLGSQILLLDTSSGLATLSSTTSTTGFESLAVAPPAQCDPNQQPPGDEDFESIPTLGSPAKLTTFLLLALFGLFALQRRGSRA